MKKIFISYRRIDFYEANRLAASLKNEYGEHTVFLDQASISGGDIWPDKIRRAVEEAVVLIVIIGKNWLFAQDEISGKRKIDLPTDWVRNEILTFLGSYKNNKELLVLPLLIDGAKMPDKELLDPELKDLCDFQAIVLPNTMNPTDFAQIKYRLGKANVYGISPLPVVTPIGDIPPDRLSKDQEEIFLTKNKLWQIKEREMTGGPGGTMRELYRVFEFKNYDEAWKFMAIINSKGIKPYNHHPRWQNTYNRVEVWLCTFNIGHQPSMRDLRLADIMEETFKGFAGRLLQS